LEVLSKALHHAPQDAVLQYTKGLSNIFLQALDMVKMADPSMSKVDFSIIFAKLPDQTFAYQAETHVISAYREFVVKLNDSTFRPVFRRLYDWAFVHEGGMSVPENMFASSQTVLGDNPRKITFFHTYCGLLDFFKVCLL